MKRDDGPPVEDRRVCPGCGNEFSGAVEFCPVCMLRKALDGGVESDESSAEPDRPETTATRVPHRFEHYEVISDKDGKPVELGRGAMGVTFKAFDVDLRCPVTLKVISEKYLANQLARLRFLREARAAASVPSSKRRLRLPPWEERAGLLLRDGVCGGGNSRQPHQALWTA